MRTWMARAYTLGWRNGFLAGLVSGVCLGVTVGGLLAWLVRIL